MSVELADMFLFINSNRSVIHNVPINLLKENVGFMPIYHTKGNNLFCCYLQLVLYKGLKDCKDAFIQDAFIFHYFQPYVSTSKAVL